jgi:hypothetical protein
MKTGSSPRARGTRFRHDGRTVHSNGFIPASAGNTSRFSRFVFLGLESVHPRERGEHELAKKPRGLRATCQRFIPASAGNTLRKIPLCIFAFLRFGSSPRARGTPQRCAQCGHRGDGSSPRARGTRLQGEGATTAMDAGSSPRARGTRDRALMGTAMSAERGSSPRARGTHLARRQSTSRHRTTRSVHPRERGEHAPRFW